jgi:RNA polymerase sigma-70 factor (ECF subfamily)
MCSGLLGELWSSPSQSLASPLRCSRRSGECKTDFSGWCPKHGGGHKVTSTAPDLTSILKRLAGGSEDAAGELIPVVYGELRRLAVRHLRRERRDHTLQPTALVHEAYIKLVAQRNADWQSRNHFFAVASSLMRRILVDYARRHLRDKRGGGQEKVSLDGAVLLAPDRADRMLVLDESLERLEKLDPRQARIVELKYFGGLTVEEAAQVLGVSPTTVRREWSSAKAWLYGELKKHNANHS